MFVLEHTSKNTQRLTRTNQRQQSRVGVHVQSIWGVQFILLKTALFWMLRECFLPAIWISYPTQANSYTHPRCKNRLWNVVGPPDVKHVIAVVAATGLRPRGHSQRVVVCCVGPLENGDALVNAVRGL